MEKRDKKIRGSESQVDRKTFSSFSFRLRRSRLARPSSSRATVAQHFAWPRRVGMLRVLHRSQDRQMIFKALDTTVRCNKTWKNRSVEVWISEIWTTSKPGQQGMGTRWIEICQGFWRWWIRCGLVGTSQFLHVSSLSFITKYGLYHLLSSSGQLSCSSRCTEAMFWLHKRCSQNNRSPQPLPAPVWLGRHHVAGSMAPGTCTGTSWLCSQGIGGASCEANPGDL